MENFDKNNIPEKKSDDVAHEILVMAQSDQEARKNWEETGEAWDRSLDKKNAARLKEIIEKIGWPTKSRVGGDAAVAAWLIVQHADHNPEFQQMCLKLMKQESEGEIRKQDMAFLEDRVRVNQGRPTLYGTQFYEDEQGVFGPRPIEDKEQLNKRREEMGMESFENYEVEMQQLNK